MYTRRSVVFLIVILILITLPIVIPVSGRWGDISHALVMFTHSRRQLNNRYSVISTTPGYTLTLKDTAYIDYMTSLLTIFTPSGVIDPAANSGHRDITKRYTVTGLRIVLVPTLDRYILGISGNDFFAGYGTYLVDKDTLVIQIALNFNDSMLAASPHAPEEVFLDVLYQTLYFAHGVTYGSDFTEGFEKNKQDMQNFLRTGIFAYPIVIQKTS